MPIPTAVFNVLGQLLNVAAYHLGERLRQTVANYASSQVQSSISPVPIEQVKSDPLYVQALLEYVQRKDARDKELLTLAATKEELRLQLQDQELKDKRQLSALQRDLMRELQAKAIEVKLTEIQTLWDKDTWFSNLSRQETEQILQRQQHRLLILVSPPKISEDCPASFSNNLEIDLRSVATFLNQHYSQHSELCPVEFYSDYFKRPISDIDVKRLQTVLAPVPTAILYSDISDYEVNFRVGFWGVQNSDAFLVPTQAWNWEQTKEELEASGESEQKSLRLIRQLIVTVHKLLAAFLADLYYLNLDPNYEPQLYNLASEFPQVWLNPYVELLSNLQSCQQTIYEKDLRTLVDCETRKAQSWKCVDTLTEHSSSVLSVTFSPNGQTLASGSSDQTINIWHLGNTNSLVGTLSGHSNFVRAVAFGPHGRTLASGSDDKTIKIWPFLTLSASDSGYVYSVAFSPDGKTLASGNGDKSIKIWDLDTGELIQTFTGHSGTIYSVAFSPDSRTLASGSLDSTLKIWDLSTGELIQTFTGHLGWVYSIAFSPDGQTIVSGGVNNNLHIWDLGTGKLIRSLSGHSNNIRSVAFSPDGQTAISGSDDKTIKIWHLNTGKLLHTLSGHSGTVNSVSFSPDGKAIASGSADKTIKIWRCA